MKNKTIFKKRSNDPKILIFDIETAPSKGWFWQMWETNIIEVEEHGYMLSFSAKWFNEKNIYTYGLPDFLGYKKKPSNDKWLVNELSRLINEADIIVAHNGDRFDITTTNTRLVTHGLPPLPPVKTVDTLKVARSKFKFLSNKLDDLGNFLSVGRKTPHTGKHLWFGCMKGDVDSWKQMKKYNEQDVRLLERVYIKLLPWMTNHPNRNVYRDTNGCPKCGSNKVNKRGFAYTTTGRKQRFWCTNCGGWSVGKHESIKGVEIR